MTGTDHRSGFEVTSSACGGRFERRHLRWARDKLENTRKIEDLAIKYGAGQGGRKARMADRAANAYL
jgi:hypothetical protein